MGDHRESGEEIIQRLRDAAVKKVDIRDLVLSEAPIQTDNLRVYQNIMQMGGAVEWIGDPSELDELEG